MSENNNTTTNISTILISTLSSLDEDQSAATTRKPPAQIVLTTPKFLDIIFSNLSPVDLLNARQTNRQWRSLIHIPPRFVTYINSLHRKVMALSKPLTKVYILREDRYYYSEDDIDQHSKRIVGVYQDLDAACTEMQAQRKWLKHNLGNDYICGLTQGLFCVVSIRRGTQSVRCEFRINEEGIG